MKFQPILMLQLLTFFHHGFNKCFNLADNTSIIDLVRPCWIAFLLSDLIPL